MRPFAGIGVLIRFALRRDRVLIPAWVIVFVGMTVSSASATMALYPDEASRLTAAQAINDVPVAVAMYGRIWDPTSLGALSLFKLAAMGGVMIGILAIMLVTRHARGEEERGRTELLGAAAVGRWAGIGAALVVSIGTVLVIGILSALGLTAIGLPAAGSWAFGLSWAATGLAFAGVSAITNQVAATGRTANALAVIVLAVAYLLRAIGDATGSAAAPAPLSWISPIGWSQQVRPFGGDRFVVLLLPLAFTVIAVGISLWLITRRDLGAGLLPDRLGHPRAGHLLRSPLGLAWRLQAPLLLAWLAAYLVISTVIGSIINDLSGMLDTPQAQQMVAALGGTDRMMDAFIAMEFGVLAFVTAAYGIVATRRIGTEELDGRTEPILATAVSRSRLLASHLVVALVGTTVLTLAQGTAFALASASRSGDPSRIGATIGAALAYLPAIWLMVAVVVLLIGAAPRLTFVAWILLVAFVLVSEMGALLSWPQWAIDASPFSHVPRLPAAAMDVTPLLVLTALAVALTGLGAVRYRRRDLATP